MSFKWKDGTPFSEEFDDVYFYPNSGLDEKRYVFLEGNNLPQKWHNFKGEFTIIETGFGTGLNFFAACQLWLKSSSPDAQLNFISIEKYLLSQLEIKEIISQYSDLIPYLELYPNGSDNITLQILECDIKEALPQITKKADAWFLDGFAPSKNPDMWSDELFTAMKKLSHEGTNYATYTSAGIVRRGLAQNGFSTEKIKGFGKKREMLRGVFSL